MRAPDRMEVLARRVRWLHRYRRVLSIVLAIGVWFQSARAIDTLMGPLWPGVLAVAAAIVIGVAAWWLIEVGFAWAIALWETEHDRLARDRGLPRARLLRGANAYRRK